MLVHRIVRAPEKRIFYVNVGSIPPNEIDAFMEKTNGTIMCLFFGFIHNFEH